MAVNTLVQEAQAGTDSADSAQRFHQKSRDLTAKATGPVSQGFHQLGKFGESTVGKAVGGEKGGFVGQVFFDPVGAGLSLLGGGERQRDVASVDPAQAARLREIDRTRKQISQGTDPLTQQRISEIRKAGETTKSQLAKVSGGDVGGTIASFLRAQRGTGVGINRAFQQGQARIPFFENLSTSLGNRIAQRKLELDINAQDTQRAQQAQAQTIENLNRSGQQAFEGDAGGGGINQLLGLLGGQQDQGGLSNIIGGGIGGAIGQGEGGFGGGLLQSIGGGTGQVGGGGVFGSGIGGNAGGGQNALGAGGGSLFGGAANQAASSGGGGAGFGEIIQKGIGAIGSLF